MRARFTAPAGWIRQPFPPPQRGIYLRAPAEPAAADSASILLLDGCSPAGTVAEQLGAFVAASCEGGQVGRRSGARDVVTDGLRGLGEDVVVRLGRGAEAREEHRVFVLLDAGELRLPLVLLTLGDGGLKARRPEFDALVQSVRVLPLTLGLFGVWAD